jgi:host cell factor
MMEYSYTKPSIPVWQMPGGRGGCSICAAESKIVVFGGQFFRDAFEYLNETWVYDNEAQEWHKMNCSGDIPAPRYGHCAHIFGSNMFVFGGFGPGRKLFNDVAVLDLISWTWSIVNTNSKAPSGRLFHASEQVGRRIVIHGGWDGETSFDDLWIFNTDSFTWLVQYNTIIILCSLI